jgi:hypothetical protein
MTKKFRWSTLCLLLAFLSHPEFPYPELQDFVTAMMDHFKSAKLLKKETVVSLLNRVKPVLKALPNVVDIDIHNRIAVRAARFGSC